MRLLLSLILVAAVAADAAQAQRGTAPRTRTVRPAPTMTLGSPADGFTWQVPRGHVVRQRDTVHTDGGPLLVDRWSVLPGHRLVTVHRGRYSPRPTVTVPQEVEDLILDLWMIRIYRSNGMTLVFDSTAVVAGKPGRILRFELAGTVADVRIVMHRGDFFVLSSARETLDDPLDPRTIAALDAFRLVD